jgi:murein DD-endopeptidase MepM/ murein hydrolase activator NlpD
VPSADTPVPPRARSPRLVRLVLLCALGGGLAGLAAPATGTAPLAMAVEHEYRPAVVVAPAVIHTTPVRRTAKASRSRPVSALWVRPVAAPITSPFGPRWGGWHPGVDFGAHYGTPIHVVGAGTVIGAGYLAGENGYGQLVLVRHSPGVVTAYAHMSRVFVHAGQHVRTGELLGLVGATGHVTGPHLHFEVRLDGAKVNPVPWLRRHGVRV